jgi:hypothetical protein
MGGGGGSVIHNTTIRVAKNIQIVTVVPKHDICVVQWKNDIYDNVLS